MGKRSTFPRADRDFYPTQDIDAVLPLMPHISDLKFFHEPCFGGGHLVQLMETFGKTCSASSDIATGIDALLITACEGEAFITNPPWSRQILHRLIAHLSAIAPTWLLFEADWAHTKQARPFLRYCRLIVSVGRVCWFPETKQTGKENVAWYLFDQSNPGPTIFVGPIA